MRSADDMVVCGVDTCELGVVVVAGVRMGPGWKDFIM